MKHINETAQGYLTTIRNVIKRANEEYGNPNLEMEVLKQRIDQIEMFLDEFEKAVD